MSFQQVEWEKSRTWLARAAFALIGAYVLLVIGMLFKPLFPIAIAAGLLALYALGRFCWHVQRSANARRLAGARRPANVVLRLMSDWPVAMGFSLAALWIVVGVKLVEVMRR